MVILENEIDTEILHARVYERREDLRGHFFRDTTAIIHSYPFRRLKHKTQVFFAPKNDHICTRIEHVMHVATIAVTLCRAFGLDLDLAWAISLGHDLGHAPFGHTGENILSEIVTDEHGFSHEEFSLRVVDYLINYGRGLNLTYAVRDGIISHCGETFEQRLQPDFSVKDISAIRSRDVLPATWEGVVVRMADKIAYLGRDVEDALQLKVVDREQIPAKITQVLGARNSEIIDTLVQDVIRYTEVNGAIGFSDSVYEAMLILKEFNYTHIYNSPLLANYHNHFARIIRNLYQYLADVFDRYGFDDKAYRREQNLLASRFGDYIAKMKAFYTDRQEKREQIIIDYLAGMTDDYAIDCISEIMIPRRFSLQFDELMLKEGE